MPHYCNGKTNCPVFFLHCEIANRYLQVVSLNVILGLFRMTGKNITQGAYYYQAYFLWKFSFKKNFSLHQGLFHSKRKYSLRDQNTQQIILSSEIRRDFLNVKCIMIHLQMMATGRSLVIHPALQLLPHHAPIPISWIKLFGKVRLCNRRIW